MIRIITDSSCDLPDDVVERHRLTVVPLTIRFGDEDFVDREQLSKDDFWSKLTGGTVTPETAAPSVGRFQEAFSRLSDEGADGVVVICISSEISATHQAAVLAVDSYGGGIPVRVIDSRLVSAALGLVVVEAAQAAEAGATIAETERIAVDAAAKSNLLATLDTLEYLKRGGRIGGAAAFFGNLLDLKPLIAFADGVVSPAGRVRTRKKAVAAILQHLDGIVDRVEALAVVHSDPDDLQSFRDEVAARYPTVMLSRLGPVVGTHAGPGVIGIAYRLK
ncbi:MAG: DegV family protein [Acidimicrobiia bacterium]